MTKLSRERKQELIKLLKSYFKKDSTAFCNLKNVSKNVSEMFEKCLKNVSKMFLKCSSNVSKNLL